MSTGGVSSESAPVLSIISEDQEHGIELFEGPVNDEAHGSARVQYWHPIGTEAYHSITTLSNGRSRGMRDDPSSVLLSLNVVEGEENWEQATAKSSIPDKLGYGLNVQAKMEDCGVNEYVFTFPTAKTLNELVGGSSADGLRFADYEGGQPDAEEYVESLVRDGTILIASKLPDRFRTHIHMSALGWLGLGGRYADRVATPLSYYLARAKQEKETGLPEHVDTEDSPTRRTLQRYLQPSAVIIEAAQQSLDYISAVVGQAYFTEPKNPADRDFQDRVGSVVRASFDLRVLLDNKLPSGVLPELEREESEPIVDDIIRRYAGAER